MDQPLFALEGIAVGGPRNGVKLLANNSWNGVVRKPANTVDAGEAYPGRYVYDVHASIWLWVPVK